MSKRAKLISSVVLAVITLATWRFMSPPAEEFQASTSEAVPEPANDAPPPAKTSMASAAAYPAPPADAGFPQNSLAVEPAKRRDDSNALTERTLVGTKWEREGFGLEFGAAGKLLIGGRERAKWRVEGQRVRLYRDTTGEEHWLDIVGDRLVWNGQEIGRVP
jgi:hypothetical protein